MHLYKWWFIVHLAGTVRSNLLLPSTVSTILTLYSDKVVENVFVTNEANDRVLQKEWTFY